MTRKKVKLAFISNDSSRKTTYNKRKKGMMKKVNELSTLCDITACAIIYSPYDSNPEVWPSNSSVQRVVSEFKTLPEMDQHKKMVDQETFLKQRISKATEHLRRQKKENRELEMREVMFQCLVGNMEMFHLNILEMNDLGYLIEKYLKDINRTIEIFRNSGMEIRESSNVVAVEAASKGIGSIADVAFTTAPSTKIHEVGSSSSAMTFFNRIQEQQLHQHFCHPAAPHGRLYEQHCSLNLNHNHNQSQQQWYMEMMNHPEKMSYAAEQMTFPFLDVNHHNCNHHYQHHQSQQQQHVPSDSSTIPATSSSSVVPVTSLNPTKNIWFL